MSQISRDLKNILKRVGFPITGEVKIIIPSELKDVCSKCKGCFRAHEVVFDPCKHSCCIPCADTAADSYEFTTGDSLETIFCCHVCSKNIINVNYT